MLHELQSTAGPMEHVALTRDLMKRSISAGTSARPQQQNRGQRDYWTGDSLNRKSVIIRLMNGCSFSRIVRHRSLDPVVVGSLRYRG